MLAALEMLVPGFFLLWIGLGAIVTAAAAALFGLGAHAQIGVFVVVTAGLIGLVAMRLRGPRALDLVNAPSAGLIGQTCRAVYFRDSEGRVSLGDGTWNARMQGDGTATSGEALTVVGLDGTTLLVASKP
jgi:membrane protein implicated in regulation of membrane protease activity